MAGLLLSFDVEMLKYANGSLINLIKHKKSESAFGRYGLFWRLAQVKIELERSLKYDYTIINDSIERAVEEIESIVRKNVAG